MNLKKLAVWTLLLLPISLQAQTTVPQYLNFQSVVMDDGGNLVTDPFVNLNFKILDKDGNLVYEEDQKSVQVMKGAVNVMIGEGTILNSSSPTGGITMEALDPREGIHFLRVTIGNNQPLNDMELLSTPYAMYAEQALSIPNNTITSDHIIDGTVKLVDLEPGLAFSNLEGMASEDQVPASLATDTELNAHISSTTAHAAANITVRGPFLASDAGNLQEVLRALDRRVMNFYNNSNEFLGNETTLRETAETTLQANINSEATTRGNADTAETVAREAAVTAEETARTNADSTELAARQAADTAEANTRATADTAEATARSTTDTTLQANIDAEVSTRSSADTTLQGQITSNDTDIAAHDSRLGTAEANITSNDSDIAGLDSRLTTAESADTMIQNQLTPIGSIIPFYDFDGAFTFNPAYWRYCDGSTYDFGGAVGVKTLPDLSNRYLVGFGTEGGEDIDTAVWDTAAVGNASHQVNLRHSHTVNSHTHTMAHTHTIAPHSHTVDSHQHAVDIGSFGSSTEGAHGHTVDPHGHSIDQHTHRWMTAGQFTWDSSGSSTFVWNADAGFHSPGDDGNNDTAAAGGNFYTELGGPTSTGGSSPGTDSQGAHSHAIDPPNTATSPSAPGTSLVALTTDGPSAADTGSSSPGTDSQLFTTQSIQPRSVRVRFIMRVQ